MMRKNESCPRDVKDKLMKEALILFTNKGYSATSVREIVEAAGVTKPVLYYYFKNKEDIYLEMIKDVMQHFEELLNKVHASNMSSSERIICLLSDLFDVSIEHLDYIRLFHSIFFGPPQGAPNFGFENFHEVIIEELMSIVKDGIKSGEFKKGKEQDVVIILTSITISAIDDNLAHASPLFNVKDLKRMLNLVINIMKK